MLDKLVFVPFTTNQYLTDFEKLSLSTSPFSDSGDKGLLLTGQKQSIGEVSKQLAKVTGLRLVPDDKPSEFGCIQRAVIITDEEFQKRHNLEMAEKILATKPPPSPWDTEYAEFRVQYREALRLVKCLESEMNDSLGSEFGIAMTEEFRAIVAHPKVLDVKVVQERSQYFIEILTDEITCNPGGETPPRSIGAFRISIPMKLLEGYAITWLNQTRLVRDRHAPHVGSSGKACLGNMQNKFEALISSKQYFAAVDMAIAFVQSVNISDRWGEQVFDWPVAVPQPPLTPS